MSVECVFCSEEQASYSHFVNRVDTLALLGGVLGVQWTIFIVIHAGVPPLVILMPSLLLLMSSLPLLSSVLIICLESGVP